jgi:hypothetical protein
MSSDEKYKGLLLDISEYIKDDAFLKKSERALFPTDLLLKGEISGYQEVIEWMREQAGALGIPLKEIYLDDLNCDGDKMQGPLPSRETISNPRHTEHPYQTFAVALGHLLRQNGLELNRKCPAGDDDLLCRGKLLTYYGIVKWMQQYADMNDVPLAEIYLDGIVPDRDLI